MSHRPTRRDVMRSGAAAVIGVSLGPSAGIPFASAAPQSQPGGAEMLRVGLIGCGGRGTGAAANALRADPDVELVALADTFGDQLERSLAALEGTPDIAQRVRVDEEHRFVGWDAYRGVIDACDVVLLATSPHFRPLHLAAAVEAGRHVFVEKPIAVDAPGVRSVRASCEEAAGRGVSIVSGLCYRYERAKRETIRRIQDGAVGEITALQCTYNAGGLWHRGNKPEWSQMEYQMRNWIYFTWLAGDHIAEQHIHSLDKLAWVMGDQYPVKCTSSGGRIVRTDERYGNVYDHFNTVYEWAGGVRGFSSCRQWQNASTEVSDWVFGTKGRANVQRHRIESGPWKWQHEREPDDDMYQNEHDALFASIRSGEPINDGAYMCGSTMMAIMGRMSAYTGQTITWDQASSSTEDLTPPAYEWGDCETPSIARPGVTKFS